MPSESLVATRVGGADEVKKEDVGLGGTEGARKGNYDMKAVYSAGSSSSSAPTKTSNVGGSAPTKSSSSGSAPTKSSSSGSAPAKASDLEHSSVKKKKTETEPEDAGSRAPSLA